MTASTIGLVRPGDPETSQHAAASINDLRASQREVLQLFRRFGPMHDKALVRCARHAGIRQSSSGLRTRRAELVGYGYLMDSGRREATESGHTAIVWTLAVE